MNLHRFVTKSQDFVISWDLLKSHTWISRRSLEPRVMLRVDLSSKPVGFKLRSSN
jgi:hypothetical protein